MVIVIAIVVIEVIVDIVVIIKLMAIISHVKEQELVRVHNFFTYY